jgi:hypothetical protein
METVGFGMMKAAVEVWTQMAPVEMIGLVGRKIMVVGIIKNGY